VTLVAITRAVSPLIGECELTHLSREQIDVARAVQQHADYEQTLRELGAEVVRAPDLPDMADGVFVEDTAVVLDELAVITRPGAESRRGETESIAGMLRRYRRTVTMPAPAMLDGGDVIHLGRMILVGRSGRTNQEGIDWLARTLAPLGYEVRGIPFTGCLHLKTAATALDDETILFNPLWLDRHAIAPFNAIAVDPAESFAANTLRIGRALIYGIQFPRTRALLEHAGYPVSVVDCTELAKAEGAVTCGSIVFHTNAPT
jgi:dimethylargininase